MAPGFVALCLVAYPTYWTFTETLDSKFGPIGVMLLLIWAFVAAAAALLGWLIRRAVERRLRQSH